MEIIGQAFAYIQNHLDDFQKALVAHLQLSLLALFLAAVTCVPLGILTSRFGTVARVIINGVGIARVIPSIAVLLVLLPVIGVGFTPAVVTLTLLAFPPILINTDAGMRGLDPATLEAARGMGMAWYESLFEVELPLALPVIIGGIRTATIEIIASATLATFIGAGGFGDFITQGLGGNDNRVVLVGAIPVAILALVAELLLATLQRLVSPTTSASFKTT
ncbi:MAG: ABC transporter permease [Chloroflexota bacterium]|nr:ABC transporter permease [Chloroflexota bacterium]